VAQEIPVVEAVEVTARDVATPFFIRVSVWVAALAVEVMLQSFVVVPARGIGT